MLGDEGVQKVVVRLSPFLAERLTENAEGTHDDDLSKGIEPPRYGLSVIAAVLASKAELDEIVERLCTNTTLNSKKVSVLLESDLIDAGFVLVADPNKLEPNHHLIGAGDLSEAFDAVALESLIRKGVRKNPRKKEIGA